MASLTETLSRTFRQFLRHEQASAGILIACTVLSIAAANSPWSDGYAALWHARVGPLSLEAWINDALMAVFFLLIGLELERELYVGELSDFRRALLPVIAACGGMLAPALIHYLLNAGTPAQAGFGIPMATDIAFALGALALLGARVPTALKVFVVAFAVMDDLGAIIVIAVFYTADVSTGHLLAALAVWAGLIVLNRLRVMRLAPYIAGGVLMWYLMLRSGIHATLTGVLLAFAIPFSSNSEDEASPSHRLEHRLHAPVAYFILPLFALANTGIAVGADWLGQLGSANSLGVMLGLLAGKPAGVVAFCAVAVGIGLCRLPDGVGWRQVIGAGMLGGIGFTMSIFITNLAFAGQPEVINASKLAVLTASLLAGTAGILWLRLASAQPRP